jgi:hypothetical protein
MRMNVAINRQCSLSLMACLVALSLSHISVKHHHAPASFVGLVAFAAPFKVLSLRFLSDGRFFSR